MIEKKSKILGKKIVILDRKNQLKNKEIKITAYTKFEVEKLTAIQDTSAREDYEQLLKCIDWTKEIFGNETEIID